MVSATMFANNAISVYKKKPKYVLGSDSYSECDCIGLVKRSLKMAGIEPTGLSGTNYAARYTIINFQPIKQVSQLQIGDVVLKGRPYTPKDNYPLPSKYLPGGSAYNGDTTNYFHIGVVTNVNPLQITHMTSPTAKQDSKLGKWNYFGKLPQVSYGNNDKQDKVVVTVEYATVIGGSLNMRKEKSTTSDKITSIPSGTRIAITEHGNEWCKAVYNAYTGYVMTKFLSFESGGTDDKITLSLSRDTAIALYNALKLSLNL